MDEGGGLRSYGRLWGRIGHTSPLELGDGWTLLLDRKVRREGSDEDDGLYPAPLSERDTVASEPEDGENVQRFTAVKLSVARTVGALPALLGDPTQKEALRAYLEQPGDEPRPAELFWTDRVSARVQITDARLTVACSKFLRGKGTAGFGNILAGILLSAWRYARAWQRRRGRMLVGHVRYPWIAGVETQHESELIVTMVADGRTVRLWLTFPKGTDVLALGDELVRRAAAYRLANEPSLKAKEVKLLGDLGSGGLRAMSPDVAGQPTARADFPVPRSPV